MRADLANLVTVSSLEDVAQLPSRHFRQTSSTRRIASSRASKALDRVGVSLLVSQLQYCLENPDAAGAEGL